MATKHTLYDFSSLEFDNVCFYKVYFKFGKVYGIFWWMLHVHLKVYSALFVWRVPGLGLALGQWTAFPPLPQPTPVDRAPFLVFLPENSISLVSLATYACLLFFSVTHLGVTVEGQKVKKKGNRKLIILQSVIFFSL